jgi:hypothetical protein
MLPTYPSWCKFIRKQIGGILHIYDPIFRQNYYVYSGTPSGFVKEFKRRGITFEEPEGDGAFKEVEHKGYIFGVIFSRDKTRSLMHECLHAAIWGLGKRGIPVSQEYDEVLAYYQSFLYKWATQK